MKGAYRVFAYLIAAEVVIQAAAIALAVFGLSTWIEDGGTLDKSVIEGDDSAITGVIGFAIHGINGTMLVPLLALLFLIISFFSKIPGGVKWAAITLGLVVLQVLLGMFAHGAYALGALHGINAFALFGVALMAGKRVNGVTTATPAPGQTATV